jgi:hypothetical protein
MWKSAPALRKYGSAIRFFRCGCAVCAVWTLDDGIPTGMLRCSNSVSKLPSRSWHATTEYPSSPEFRLCSPGVASVCALSTRHRSRRGKSWPAPRCPPPRRQGRALRRRGAHHLTRTEYERSIPARAFSVSCACPSPRVCTRAPNSARFTVGMVCVDRKRTRSSRRAAMASGW